MLLINLTYKLTIILVTDSYVPVQIMKESFVLLLITYEWLVEAPIYTADSFTEPECKLGSSARTSWPTQSLARKQEFIKSLPSA